MVAHFTMRTHGVNYEFRFVEGIWLHLKSHKIRFFFSKKRHCLHHTCLTLSFCYLENLSNCRGPNILIWAMGHFQVATILFTQCYSFFFPYFYVYYCHQQDQYFLQHKTQEVLTISINLKLSISYWHVILWKRKPDQGRCMAIFITLYYFSTAVVSVWSTSTWAMVQCENIGSASRL